MADFNLGNPVFATYVVAACLMILKAVAMSWLTVVRMMGANGGLPEPGRHEEDADEPQSQFEPDVTG